MFGHLNFAFDLQCLCWTTHLLYSMLIVDKIYSPCHGIMCQTHMYGVNTNKHTNEWKCKIFRCLKKSAFGGNLWPTWMGSSPKVLHKCITSFAANEANWPISYKALQIQPNAARPCVKSIISWLLSLWRFGNPAHRLIVGSSLSHSSLLGAPALYS